MATPTVIVSPPNQIFTLSRRFGAAAGGYIYVGKVDTDPALPQNQVPVYVQQEDGSFIEIPQPVRINAAGNPEYEGKIVRILVSGSYSMKIYDYGMQQQYFFPNLMKYDPDQFPAILKGATGWDMVGAGNNSLKEEIRQHGATTSSYGIGWKDPADANKTTDHSAALKAMFKAERYVIVDTVCNTADRLESQFTYQRFEATGVGVIRPITSAMANKAVLQLNHSYCQVAHLVIDNIDSLKTVSGPGRQVGVDIRADFCMVRESIFFRCLQGVQASADKAARGTKVLNCWFFEHLGAGDVTGATGVGEDRGDAVTIWGSESIVMGNYAFCRADQDARIAFHCEDVHLQTNPRPEVDGHYNAMIGNYAAGPFRRHFVFENQTNSMMIGNVSGGGATWWGEAMAMCKNCKSDNVIYWDLKSGVTTGATWSPVRGAVCAVNYNTDVVYGSKVIFSADAVGYGFVTGTQTGEHVMTLDLDMQGNNNEDSAAVYLIRPKECILRGCRLVNFYHSIKLVGTSGGVTFSPTVIDKGSYHSSGGTCVYMTTGSGGTYIASDCQYITPSDYGISLSNMDKLVATSCGFDVASAPISTFPKAGTVLRVLACYSMGTNAIAMRVSGSTQFTVGTDSDWFFSANGFRVGVLHALTALQSATSKLNTLHRYSGMVVSVQRAATFDMYISLTGNTGAEWQKISTDGVVTPA